RMTLATFGAMSKSDWIELRVLASVLFSRYAPNRNRNVTIPASVYSWMINAPMTAMVIKSSMLELFTATALHARCSIRPIAANVAKVNVISLMVEFPVTRNTSPITSIAPEVYISLFKFLLNHNAIISRSSIFYVYADVLTDLTG